MVGKKTGTNSILYFSGCFHVKKSFFSLWLNEQHFSQNNNLSLVPVFLEIELTFLYIHGILRR